MALAVYHILLDKEHFCDLGSDYFNTIYAEKIKKRNIQSLEKLGFSESNNELHVIGMRKDQQYF